jgi:hypothetical protein
MLGWKLLSDLMFPMIVARALRSEILVFSWSFCRTYFSLSLHPGHFQVLDTTSIGTALFSSTETSTFDVDAAQAEMGIEVAIKIGRNFLSIKLVQFIIRYRSLTSHGTFGVLWKKS